MKLIKKLFLSGASTDEIVKKSGFSQSTVYSDIKEMGIRPKSFRQRCRDNGVNFNSVNSAINQYLMSENEAIEHCKTSKKVKFEYKGVEGLPQIAKKFKLNYNSLINVIYRIKVTDINEAIEIVKANTEAKKNKPKKPEKPKLIIKQPSKPTEITPYWKIALGITA